MNEKKLDKIHQKVASALGIDVPDEETVEEEEIALVPVPESHEITVIENADLPDMSSELTRIEHADRQMEFLIDVGMPVVEQNLADALRMPPIYRARHVEAGAKLLEVMVNLIDAKHKHNMDLIEKKMKMAQFERSKGGPAAPPNVTGNTFVFGTREELIRAYEQTKTGQVNEDDDDESET